MKKLKNIKGLLSREEMKAISGGCGTVGKLHKCCWNGTSNCSSCADGTVCVSGAYLADC